MTKPLKASNNNHSFESNHTKAIAQQQQARQHQKHSNSAAKQRPSATASSNLKTQPQLNQPRASNVQKKGGKPLVDSETALGAKSGKTLPSRQSKKTGASPNGEHNKKSSLKSPKVKTDPLVSEKWSGSTFHSSPNAATLPRPPFAKTSPPAVTKSIATVSSVPTSFENLHLGGSSQPTIHHPVIGQPLMPQQMMPQPAAPINMSAGGIPQQRMPAPYMQQLAPQPSNGMYGAPVFGNHIMAPQNYMRPGMPMPFGINNHPMGMNPMFLAPPVMPMPQSGKAENC